MINEETREDFMQSMYDMFSDDSTNDRANQIIDIFDISTENCIELPCAVGDTVFVSDYAGDCVGTIIADEFIFRDNKIFIIGTHGEGEFEYGKTVFLTPEEAEKALEERETNG